MSRIPSLEADLLHWEIPYTYHEQVKLTDINIAGSYQNPMRLGSRINPETVSSVFCRVVEHGNTTCIPAVVCAMRDGRPYRLLDGVNRCKGILEAEDYSLVDIYLIESTDEFVLDWLAGTLNNANGVAPPQDQRLARAIQLLGLYPNTTVDEIARRTNLKKDDINELIKVKKQTARAQAMDIEPKFNSLRPQLKAQFNSITIDQFFIMAVNALVSTNVGIGVSKDLIKNVAKAKSEKEASDIIQIFHDENPPPKPKIIRGPATSTQQYRDDERRLLRHWPGSVERYQFGSLNLVGLENLLSIVTENHERRTQIITYIQDLIKHLKERAAA